MVGPLLPIANPLIVHRLNKDRTTVTSEFINSLNGLTTTTFTVNNELLEATTELAILELEQLRTKLLEIYNGIKGFELFDGEISGTSNILEIINSVANLQKINNYKKGFIEKRLANQIQNFDHSYKEIKTINDFLKTTKELESLRAWVSSL